jgi:hypothetical protein
MMKQDLADLPQRLHALILNSEPSDKETLDASDDWDSWRFAEVRSLVLGELTRLVSSASSLRKMSRDAYRHDNGFTKYVLGTSVNPATEVRLHYWPVATTTGADQQRMPNIHNHTSSFISVVLHGALLSTTYRVDNDADDESSAPSYFSYDCEGRNDETYAMISAGRARLRVLSEVIVRVSQLHSLPNHALHRIIPAEDKTLTLFIQGPRLTSRTRVYSERHIPSAGRRLLPSLSAEELQTGLAEISNLLGET